ncbi:hypothetical protein NKJ10_31595, partial [Mesorhizobium sp. M0204]|uniref:hypothetical protein n=1 Tax=Mesorhizobium sp. M0204 TaxID=2956913 RepID=UPI00333820AF
GRYGDDDIRLRPPSVTTNGIGICNCSTRLIRAPTLAKKGADLIIDKIERSKADLYPVGDRCCDSSFTTQRLDQRQRGLRNKPGQRHLLRLLNPH